MKETSVERIVGEEKCTLYTSERKFISKIEQYKEIYPDLVDFEKTLMEVLLHMYLLIGLNLFLLKRREC